MRRILLTLTLISLVLSVTSCYGFAIIRIDGPYEGKVIDVDTGEPIEGVVVLGIWYKQNPGPGGAVSEYYDAMETVTDKNGEFKIKGLGLLVMSNVIPMDVLIFKAGYTHYGMITWKELKGLYKIEDNKAIIRLRKLTMEERRKSRPSIPPTEAPLKKIRLMLDEINKNEMDLGAEPYDIWEGEKVYEKNDR
jgi:hypothetical protein